MPELMQLGVCTYIHSWVSEPQLRYHERNVWALKSDEHTVSTVQHLSLLELEGRLKALNSTKWLQYIYTCSAYY